MRNIVVLISLIVILTVGTALVTAQPGDIPITVINHDFYIGGIHTGMDVSAVGADLKLYGTIAKQGILGWCALGEKQLPIICAGDQPQGRPGIVNSILTFDGRFYIPHAGGVALRIGGLGMGFIAVFGNPTRQEVSGNTIQATWITDPTRNMGIEVQMDAPSNKVYSLHLFRYKR